jgi:hypothetical protein
MALRRVKILTFRSLKMNVFQISYLIICLILTCFNWNIFSTDWFSNSDWIYPFRSLCSIWIITMLIVVYPRSFRIKEKLFFSVILVSSFVLNVVLFNITTTNSYVYGVFWSLAALLIHSCEYFVISKNVNLPND